MHKPTRNGSLAVAAAVAATLAFAPAASASPDPGLVDPSGTTARVGGEDRYETAVAASKSRAWGSTVIITSGQDYADTLAAGPLADVLDAPILLTGATLLPIATANEVARLAQEADGGIEVVVVGGLGAVSADVAADLANISGVNSVERVGGGDRYETAHLVAQRTAEHYDGVEKPEPTDPDDEDETPEPEPTEPGDEDEGEDSAPPEADLEALQGAVDEAADELEAAQAAYQAGYVEPQEQSDEARSVFEGAQAKLETARADLDEKNQALRSAQEDHADGLSYAGALAALTTGTDAVTVPVLDEETGEPVLDDEGDPVTETIPATIGVKPGLKALTGTYAGSDGEDLVEAAVWAADRAIEKVSLTDAAEQRAAELVDRVVEIAGQDPTVGIDPEDEAAIEAAWAAHDEAILAAVDEAIEAARDSRDEGVTAASWIVRAQDAADALVDVIPATDADGDPTADGELILDVVSDLDVALAGVAGSTTVAKLGSDVAVAQGAVATAQRAHDVAHRAHIAALTAIEVAQLAYDALAEELPALQEVVDSAAEEVPLAEARVVAAAELVSNPPEGEDVTDEQMGAYEAALEAANRALQRAEDALETAEVARDAKQAEIDEAGDDLATLQEAKAEAASRIERAQAAYDAAVEALEEAQAATAEHPEAAPDANPAAAQPTSEEVEEELEPVADPAQAPVFVVSGENYPDALAASAAAAQVGGVLLLTREHTLNPEVNDYLSAEEPEQVYAIGGPAASALGDLATDELVGGDRYETAVLTAKEFFADFDRAALASGEGFVDGVVAAAFIANADGPLLLTRTDFLSGPTKDLLEGHKREVDIFVFGGEAAVSKATFDAAEQARKK